MRINRTEILAVLRETEYAPFVYTRHEALRRGGLSVNHDPYNPTVRIQRGDPVEAPWTRDARDETETVAYHLRRGGFRTFIKNDGPHCARILITGRRQQRDSTCPHPATSVPTRLSHTSSS